MRLLAIFLVIFAVDVLAAPPEVRQARDGEKLLSFDGISPTSDGTQQHQQQQQPPSQFIHHSHLPQAIVGGSLSPQMQRFSHSQFATPQQFPVEQLHPVTRPQTPPAHSILRRRDPDQLQGGHLQPQTIPSNLAMRKHTPVVQGNAVGTIDFQQLSESVQQAQQVQHVQQQLPVHHEPSKESEQRPSLLPQAPSPSRQSASAASLPQADEDEQRQQEALPRSLSPLRIHPILETKATTEQYLRTTVPSPVRPPQSNSVLPIDKSVDLDEDGQISLNEVQYAAFVHHGLGSSVVQSLFKEVDRDLNGFLNPTEFNDIRPLVLAKAENAALHYMENVDKNGDGHLSLNEAQTYILKEYGIGHRDVERIWRLVMGNSIEDMDAIMFAKLRRRIRGMSIRLARQLMKTADTNADEFIDSNEARTVAFEQEGINAGDVVEMVASVDDDNDGLLNAPEFADFERIVRSRSVDTAGKALKMVDRDGSGTVSFGESKRIAFEHYGFDEHVLEPFFAQADENEDGQLDAVEFAGFRQVIRSRAVRNALEMLKDVDTDRDGFVDQREAIEMARRQDDMEPQETINLINVADQDQSGRLDKVELADFIRLIRLSAIKFATDHFREFDTNKDKAVTIDELESLIEAKYHVIPAFTQQIFQRVDADDSGDLNPAEIVDFRHEIRKHVAERDAHQRPQAVQPAQANGKEKEDGHRAPAANHQPQPQRPRAHAEPTTTTGPMSQVNRDITAAPSRLSDHPTTSKPYVPPTNNAVLDDNREQQRQSESRPSNMPMPRQPMTQQFPRPHDKQAVPTSTKMIEEQQQVQAVNTNDERHMTASSSTNASTSTADPAAMEEKIGKIMSKITEVRNKITAIVSSTPATATLSLATSAKVSGAGSADDGDAVASGETTENTSISALNNSRLKTDNEENEKKPVKHEARIRTLSTTPAVEPKTPQATKIDGASGGTIRKRGKNQGETISESETDEQNKQQTQATFEPWNEQDTTASDVPGILDVTASIMRQPSLSAKNGAADESGEYED